MINTFVVNFRDNNDVNISNKLQVALGEAMNIYVGSKASRIPLMIMQTGLNAKSHGKGLKVFKKRAGLQQDDTDLNVLVNTCMNPWQQNESISEIGDVFRKIVLNCMAIFETIPPGYNDSDKNIPNLYNILHLSDWEHDISVRLVNDLEGETISLKVVDIPLYQRLDISAEVDYPEKQYYFIYGDTKRTIMSHVITKLPDIQHTVTLTERPHSMTEIILDQGVVAVVKEVNGSPLLVGNEFKEPLQRKCYEVSFIGELNTRIHTNVHITETKVFNIVHLSAV